MPKQRLTCTHRAATLSIGGMQSYRASDYWPWKSVFHGGSLRDNFCGGDRDDMMYDGAGNDTADDGPGQDICKSEVKKRC